MHTHLSTKGHLGFSSFVVIMNNTVTNIHVVQGEREVLVSDRYLAAGCGHSISCQYIPGILSLLEDSSLILHRLSVG